MQIITTKRFRFQDFEISFNPGIGENVAKLIKAFEVKPSMRPQFCPDWCRNDDLFDLALSDGSLFVIGEIPAKEHKPEPVAEPFEIAQPANELSDSDLELLNKPLKELTGNILNLQSYPTLKGWPAEGKI
jgi:hypothetical protein